MKFLNKIFGYSSELVEQNAELRKDYTHFQNKCNDLENDLRRAQKTVERQSRKLEEINRKENIRKKDATKEVQRAIHQRLLFVLDGGDLKDAEKLSQLWLKYWTQDAPVPYLPPLINAPVSQGLGR